jgi:hypothetical protein
MSIWIRGVGGSEFQNSYSVFPHEPAKTAGHFNLECRQVLRARLKENAFADYPNGIGRPARLNFARRFCR